jgi:1,4-alpha-glucan branching enzyme
VLWQSDYDTSGFYWIDCADHQSSIFSFARQNSERTSELVVIMNLTPVLRMKYRIGLPRPGGWREVLNSDAAIYGGSNAGNLGGVKAEDYNQHNQSYSAEFTLPPLSVMVFQPER